MTLSERFKSALDTVVSAFEKVPADWMLIGAIPVAAWARARATTDIDFIVEVDAAVLDEKLMEADVVKMAGPVQIAQKPLTLSKYWVGPDPGKVGIGIDVFQAAGEWQKSSLARRVKVAFGTDSYWVATPEDLLLYKLLANRVHDINDVATIFEKRYASLDWDYVWTSAAKIGLGLQDLLKNIAGQYQVEAGLSGPFPWEKA